MDLDTLMTIGHVVRVLDDGTVTDKTPDGQPLGIYAPEVVCGYTGPFAEAQILAEHDAALIEYLADQGWKVETGWSHQYLTRRDDPIMHTAEYIGGALADHILATPGYWVALSVEIHPGEDDPEHEDNDGSGESETAGWIVAHTLPVPDIDDRVYMVDLIGNRTEGTVTSLGIRRSDTFTVQWDNGVTTTERCDLIDIAWKLVETPEES